MRRVGRAKAVSILMAVAAAVGLLAPAAGAAPAHGDSTGYQGNAAHTGVTSGARLPDGMKRRWGVTFGTLGGHPVIVGNRLFVTGMPVGQKTGPQVHAFDLRTGRRLWVRVLGAVSDLPGWSAWSGLAYSGGRLYASRVEGVVHALDPATGRVLWQHRLSEGLRLVPAVQPVDVDAPLTAAGGQVYAVDTANRLVYALDGARGSLRWVRPGHGGAVSVGKTGLFVGDDCEVRRFTLDGREVWRFAPQGACETGATPELPLTGDGLWMKSSVNDTPHTFTAPDGVTLRRVPSQVVPLVAGRTVVRLTRGPDPGSGTLVLTATDAVTGRVRWQRMPTPATYGPLNGELSSAGGVVYVRAGRGTVFGYELTTGRRVWQGDTGEGLLLTRPTERHGMAIGGGALAVTSNRHVVVFR